VFQVVLVMLNVGVGLVWGSYRDYYITIFLCISDTMFYELETWNLHGFNVILELWRMK